MTATKYPFSIQDDFPQHKVNSDRLLLELGATALAPLVARVDTFGDECGVWFIEALEPEEVALLEDVVAAHSGEPLTHVEFRASTALVGDPKEVTAEDWTDVGGVVTNVSFFVADIDLALGRIVGQVKTNGPGADLRIMKADDTVLLGPVSLPDTQDVWTVFSYTTNPGMPLTEGESLYVVQARRDGATSLAFRYTSFTLLEIVS